MPQAVNYVAKEIRVLARGWRRGKVFGEFFFTYLMWKNNAQHQKASSSSSSTEEFQAANAASLITHHGNRRSTNPIHHPANKTRNIWSLVFWSWADCDGMAWDLPNFEPGSGSFCWAPKHQKWVLSSLLLVSYPSPQWGGREDTQVKI
jgi:hypothetical protein